MSKIATLKEIGIKGACEVVYERIEKKLAPKYFEKRWKNKSKKAGYLGVSIEKREVPLIVSLTSFPGRINAVHKTVQTLLTQTLKPDKLILWLADSQFPNREDDLPKELTKLEEYGLTISWCEDIRSYKKLIPTIDEYPEAVIVTTDDDMYYHPQMVERLYNAYKESPNDVHCHRATKFYMENDAFKVIPGGYDTYNRPSYLHKLTGVGGVLYPPHSLYKDICNKELFTGLAPSNDDIWFWIMAVLNGRRVNSVKNRCSRLYYVESSQEVSLSSVNDGDEGLLWKQFDNVLNYYPEARERLVNEYKDLSIEGGSYGKRSNKDV